MDVKQRTDHGIVPKHTVIHLVETQMVGVMSSGASVESDFCLKAKGLNTTVFKIMDHN